MDRAHISLSETAQTGGHGRNRKPNNIQQQIYEEMLRWEICPQTTFRMMLLNLQLMRIFYIYSVMAESLRLQEFFGQIMGPC